MRIEVDVSDYAIGRVLLMELWEWKVETSSISFKVFEWDWKGLQNTQQRDVGNHKRTKKLEIFVRGC